MRKPLPELREIRSFHIGGSVRTQSGLPLERRRFNQNGLQRPFDPNGEHIVGQMYVQAFLQTRPTQMFPVLFWHGGGMTGANWETTPDGRAGWVSEFLHAGFDVYVSDAVERGRASWARWPEFYADAPVCRTLQDGWDMFRIGALGSYSSDATLRKAHHGQQFPVEAFDKFAAQWVPRWDCNNELTLAAYDALLLHVGKCIVIGHSQGGGFALEAVRRRLENVAAVVALEPSGAPVRDQQINPALPPHLVVWGDYMEEGEVWTDYRSAVDGYFCELSAAGVPARTCDLPREGITGNSHFPMMDRNSAVVAKRVVEWLSAAVSETVTPAIKVNDSFQGQL